MPYKVLLAKTAFKSYLKITGKLRTGVDRCFLDLANSPEHGSSIRKLTGLKDCYRYQIGGFVFCMRCIRTSMKSGYMLSGREAMSTSTDFFEEHSIGSHIPPCKGVDITNVF